MTFTITGLVRGMKHRREAILPAVIFTVLAFGIYAFFAIADEVGENEIAGFDTYLLLLFRDPANPSQPIGPPWLAETVTEITALGGYPIMVVVVSAVIGFLLVSRKYGPALFVLLSTSTGALASHLLKLHYERPRPDVVDHLVSIHTASFPSGHATMSTVVYLTLASLVIRLVDEFRVRVYVVAVAVLMALAVGISRVYLGVHWPSDVAAGWALGVAWASLCWLIASALQFQRRRRKQAVEDEQ